MQISTWFARTCLTGKGKDHYSPLLEHRSQTGASVATQPRAGEACKFDWNELDSQSSAPLFLIAAAARLTAKRERSAVPPFRVSPRIHFQLRAEPSSSERCSWRVHWHRPESRTSRRSRWLHSNRVLPELVLWWIRNPVSLLRLFPLSRNH